MHSRMLALDSSHLSLFSHQTRNFEHRNDFSFSGGALERFCVEKEKRGGGWCGLVCVCLIQVVKGVAVVQGRLCFGFIVPVWRSLRKVAGTDLKSQRASSWSDR